MQLWIAPPLYFNDWPNGLRKEGESLHVKDLSEEHYKIEVSPCSPRIILQGERIWTIFDD